MAARVFKYPSSASSWAEDHKWDRSAAWEWNIDMLTSGMSDPMFNLLVEFGNKDAIRKQDNSLFELEQRMISEFNAARAAAGGAVWNGRTNPRRTLLLNGVPGGGAGDIPERAQVNGGAFYSAHLAALGADVITDARLPDAFMYDADAAYSGILLKFTDLERVDDDSSVRPEPLPARQQLLDIGKEAFTTDTFMVHRMLLLLRAMRPTPTSEVVGPLRRRFMVSVMVQEASLGAYVDFLVRMRARIELYDRTKKPSDVEMKEKLEHAISTYAASPANDEYDRRILMIKSAHSELEAGDLAAGDPKRRVFDSFSTMSDRISREEQAAAAEGAHRDDHHASYDIDVLAHRPRMSESVHTTNAIGQLKNDSYFDPKSGSRKNDPRRAISKTVDKFKRQDDQPLGKTGTRVSGMPRRTLNPDEIRRQFESIKERLEQPNASPIETLRAVSAGVNRICNVFFTDNPDESHPDLIGNGNFVLTTESDLRTYARNSGAMPPPPSPFVHGDLGRMPTTLEPPLETPTTTSSDNAEARGGEPVLVLRTHEQLDDFVDQLTSELNYDEIAIAIDCRTQAQLESASGTGAIVDLDTQTARSIEQYCFASSGSATHYQVVYDGAASVGIAHNKGVVVPGSLVALDVDVRIQTGVAPTTTSMIGLQLHTQQSALDPNVMYVIPALSLLSETFPFSIASNKTHQGQGIGMQTPPRDTTHLPNYIYTAKDGVEVIPINIASASRSSLKSAVLLKETPTGIPIMSCAMPSSLRTCASGHMAHYGEGAVSMIDFVTGKPFSLDISMLARLFDCPTNPGFLNDRVLRAMATGLKLVTNGERVTCALAQEQGN